MGKKSMYPDLVPVSAAVSKRVLACDARSQPSQSLTTPFPSARPSSSRPLKQVLARLREFATIRAMEAAHRASALAATGQGAAALARRSGESGKPCKLRMRSAQETGAPQFLFCCLSAFWFSLQVVSGSSTAWYRALARAGGQAGPCPPQ